MTEFYIIGEQIYARATSQARMLAFSFDECRDRHNVIVTGMPKLLGGYHLWQSQDDNRTSPTEKYE